MSSHDKKMPRLTPKPRPSILLVEDNEISRKVIFTILKRLGYFPDTAENGLQALKVMESQRYDLILMDMMMPELDGIKTTIAIRACWPPDEQPYIIAITASALLHDMKSCIKAGMNDYLNKPFSLEELQVALIKSNCAKLVV